MRTKPREGRPPKRPPRPPPAPRPAITKAIDWQYFPHIVEKILVQAPPEAYAALRATCRELYDRFSPWLYDHIEVRSEYNDDDRKAGRCYYNSPRRIVSPSPPGVTPGGRLLPGLKYGDNICKVDEMDKMSVKRITEHTRYIDNSDLVPYELVRDLTWNVTLRTFNSTTDATCLCHRRGKTTLINFQDFINHNDVHEEQGINLGRLTPLCNGYKTIATMEASKPRRIIHNIRYDARYPHLGYGDLEMDDAWWRPSQVPTRPTPNPQKAEIVFLFTRAKLMQGTVHRKDRDREVAWFGILTGLMDWVNRYCLSGTITFAGLENLPPWWLGKPASHALKPVAERLRILKETFMSSWIEYLEREGDAFLAMAADEEKLAEYRARVQVISLPQWRKQVGKEEYDLATIPPPRPTPCMCWSCSNF